LTVVDNGKRFQISREILIVKEKVIQSSEGRKIKTVKITDA